MTTALVDGDILLYRIGFGHVGASVEAKYEAMDKFVRDIIEAVGADSFRIFLSAGRTDTFRARLYPEYKANRTQPKPEHYQELKDFLINEWNAEVQIDQEADDALGINQNADTIILSVDKDLFQIPGNHYTLEKWRNGVLIKPAVFSFVLEEEGLAFFYRQLLIGDTVDNIKGIKGIGPAKAEKLIPDAFMSEEEMFEVVFDKYLDEANGDEQKAEERMLLNGQLLKIRRKENEVWEFPKSLNNLDGITSPETGYLF